jgi:hypothetical protein
LGPTALLSAPPRFPLRGQRLAAGGRREGAALGRLGTRTAGASATDTAGVALGPLVARTPPPQRSRWASLLRRLPTGGHRVAYAGASRGAVLAQRAELRAGHGRGGTMGRLIPPDDAGDVRAGLSRTAPRAHLHAQVQAAPAASPLSAHARPRSKTQVAKGALAATQRFDRRTVPAGGPRDAPSTLGLGTSGLSGQSDPRARLVNVAMAS